MRKLVARSTHVLVVGLTYLILWVPAVVGFIAINVIMEIELSLRKLKKWSDKEQ